MQVDTIGSNFNTVLAVLTGTAADALAQVALDDYSGGNNDALLTFNVTAGTTYRLQVSGFGFDQGAVRLNLGPPRIPGPAPVNDAFLAPTMLTGTTVSASGNTSFATAQPGEPDHWPADGGSAATGSVWFSWTAPYSGDFVISTVGSRFDTVLAIYTGTSIGSLTRLAADDQSGGFLSSRLILTATGGVNYRIAVDGYAFADRGDYFLNITPVPALLSGTLTRGIPTNTITLRWQSEPWTTYRIEQSTNLTLWAPVINCAASGGTQTEIDVTGIPATTPRLFFRVLRP